MISGFRLMVYAIVAAALISAAYAIMYPMLFPGTENIALIENSLKAGETGLGLGFKSRLELREGEGLRGESFDTSSRNVAFQCNNASLCCPRTEECSLAIEWDSRIIKFKERVHVPATSRCEYEHGLFACTVYFGEEPAQVEIESVNAKEEVDLSRESMSFEVEFLNTGKQRAEQVEVSAKIYQRYLEGGEWKDVLLQSVSKTESYGKMEAGEKMKKTIYIDLFDNGPFKAKIRVGGLEAGFSEKVVNFSASGAQSPCSASSCEEPKYAGFDCVVRCHCEGCSLGSECREKLVQKGNKGLGVNDNINLGEKSYDILGSNIVEFKVSPGYCP